MFAFPLFVSSKQLWIFFYLPIHFQMMRDLISVIFRISWHPSKGNERPAKEPVSQSPHPTITEERIRVLISHCCLQLPQVAKRVNKEREMDIEVQLRLQISVYGYVRLAFLVGIDYFMWLKMFFCSHLLLSQFYCLKVKQFWNDSQRISSQQHNVLCHKRTQHDKYDTI